MLKAIYNFHKVYSKATNTQEQNKTTNRKTNNNNRTVVTSKKCELQQNKTEQNHTIPNQTQIKTKHTPFANDRIHSQSKSLTVSR